MAKKKHSLVPLADRGPLRVMFVITSMTVGGAETLLVDLVRRLDRQHFVSELCCLKQFGPLGEVLAGEIPAIEHVIRGKYDVGVWRRLSRLLRSRRIDAVITVGAGDKMFWGRLAAWRAGVPVVISALHSTGWPDGVGKLNRLLTPLTDAFIGVAEPHGRYLVERERFPAGKVHVIPNGVDIERFRPTNDGARLRCELGISLGAPVTGIVAALRPEKNHELFLQSAALVRQNMPTAQFIIVGDGPERPRLEALAAQLGIASAVHFLGTRPDVPQVLAALNVFALTSHNEANPVSILEALATGKPVVATDVGSVAQSVRENETGFLAPAGDAAAIAVRLTQLLGDRELAARLGSNGRKLVVENWSLERMVRGYEELIAEIYQSKCSRNFASSARQPEDQKQLQPLSRLAGGN